MSNISEYHYYIGTVGDLCVNAKKPKVDIMLGVSAASVPELLFSFSLYQLIGSSYKASCSTAITAHPLG